MAVVLSFFTVLALFWVRAEGQSVSRIAFVSQRDGNPEIYTVNPDGSGVERLTYDPASDLHPAWSPDGQRIAFTSNRAGNADIWVMNADGTNAFRLVHIVEKGQAVDIGYPAWIDNGQRIAFQSERKDKVFRWTFIWVVNVDGTNPWRLGFLSNENEDDIHPIRGPTSYGITFLKVHLTGYTLLAHYEFSDVVSITNIDHNARSIDYSSTRELAYAGDRDIWISEEDSGNEVNVTHTSDPVEVNSNLSWSPNGSQIAYEANGKIRIISRDGTAIRTITEGGDPDWSPLLSDRTNVAPGSWGSVKSMVLSPY